MANQNTINDRALRLLLPNDWVDELDAIAREHFKSRLALIRQYIREKIDDDLLDLDQKVAQRHQVNRAKSNVDEWRQRESKQREAYLKRKQEDEW